MFNKENKFLRFKGIALIAALLIAALGLTACGTDPEADPYKFFDNAFTATGEQLNKELEDIVYKNAVLAEVDKTMAGSSKMALELPPVVAMMGIPTSIEMRNDAKNKIFSVNTSMMGRDAGLYLDDEHLTVQFLRHPVVISAKNFGRDLNVWLVRNGLSSITAEIPLDMLGVNLDDLDISYSTLIAPAFDAKANQERSEAWIAYYSDIFNELMNKIQYEVLDAEALEIQEGTVDTTVIGMTISQADLEEWMVKFIVVFENDEIFDEVFGYYEAINQIAGENIYPTKSEVIRVLEDLDLAGVEDLLLKCNIYKGKVIKLELSTLESDDFNTISVGFFGKDNLLDMVEFYYSDNYESYTVLMEGNLIPKNNKVFYKVSYIDVDFGSDTSTGGFKDVMEIEWDLSVKDGDNFLVMADGETVSFFMGLNGDNNFEMSIDIPEIGGTVRFYVEPLDEEIVIPTGGQNLLELDMNALSAELMGILW